MPVDLLHQLEAGTPPPPEQPENIDHVLQLIPQIIQRIRWAVEHAQGSVRLFEQTWQGLIAAVTEGRTAEVQQVREQFRKAVEDRLQLLQHARDRARLLRDLGMQNVPDPATLLPEITGMERIKIQMCDRWQTAEDLEDLAARDYPLTTADLDRLGPQRRPPASWYGEEGKPF